MQVSLCNESDCMGQPCSVALEGKGVRPSSTYQQTSAIWTVEVEKSETSPLGMRTKKEKDHLLIVAVAEEGSASFWNQKNSSLAVRPGDKILRVNDDVDDPWEMIHLLWQGARFGYRLLESRRVVPIAGIVFLTTLDGATAQPRKRVILQAKR